jgi:large subunit ribosomal protein L29
VNIKELREQDGKGLTKELESLCRALFSLRMQLGTQQLSKTSQISSTKRGIAKVKTIIREKELGIINSK